jgi:E3 ubiquitin-protein ligase RNF213
MCAESLCEFSCVVIFFHTLPLIFVVAFSITSLAHMGLFTEVIVRRSVNGKPLMDGIQVLAALNPYRLRKNQGSDAPGLVFQLHGASTTPDPMRALVYRVHPVPATLQGFIFDFGSLTCEHEQMYITSMAKNVVLEGSVEEKDFIASLIYHAQQFVRQEEGDASATSLRDVRRCLNLINWFMQNLSSKKESPIAPLAASTVLAIAFTYYYRLANQGGN